MTPYSQSSDEANRARYLAEDQRNNAANAARSQNAAQVSHEVQARRSAEAKASNAEAKVSHLKEVLRFVRDYHIHSMPSEASSVEQLCCEFCRQIDEALRL